MVSPTNPYSSLKKSHSRSFKDHYLERKILISRCIIAIFLVVITLLVLLIHNWYLQVVLYKDFQTRSNNNRISIQPIAPKRGLIYDRHGVLLAENNSIYSLEIIPEKVNSLNDTLQRLMDKGLIEEKHREKFFNDLKGQRRFKSLPVKAKLSEKEVALFSVDRHQFPGVSIEARLVRHYPFGKSFAHALGYVGRINDRELTQIDQANYKATRHIGKVGLEKYYEDILHGVIGFRKVETDVQGRIVGKPLLEQLPEPGKNIKLSIDARLQEVAAKVLENELGAVVAVDPRNGEILALASNPAYDPNDFVTGISSVDYSKLSTSKDRPLFNRAIRGLYSPGSIIKPHLGWLALEKKLISGATTIHDPGFWILPNKEQRVYRDWKLGGHGKNINLAKAIIESCDTYFYDLAYRMGIDTLSEGMKQFGFGQYTGIDMGEEVPGIMPSREWKKEKLKQDWYPGETIIVGIGQGYWNATPLQMANAMTQLATGKTRFELHLVKEHQIDSEWISFEPNPALIQADFSNQDNLKLVQRSMRKVNTSLKGTGNKAFAGTEYTSAGKTGTVQLKAKGKKYDESKLEKKFWNHALYAGYAPYENPEIVVLVIIENGGGGGTIAAPKARNVFDTYFKNKTLDEAFRKEQKERLTNSNLIDLNLTKTGVENGTN